MTSKWSPKSLNGPPTWSPTTAKISPSSHSIAIITFKSNTNHVKAMLSATIAEFFTVAPAKRNPSMDHARFQLRTGVTINEETTPENNKQKKV
ncbi:hypothetical protein TNCV_3941421 [Trichonephila clavipes]|uniref:Uncharacterized protein n=1 Tax=Trichonephila clavipes TaxID=2585209 RepID=A0A8X6VVZ5_TRICX|nr:hypothetical protein TNCV_3941421 [Trichonephila clavipes]